MPNAMTMANDLESILREYRELAAPYLDAEGNITKSIPDETQGRLTDLHQRGVALKTSIAEERNRAQTQDMANLNDFLNKPDRAPLHALNADDDGRKTLNRLGWDVQNGIILAPTSIPNPLLMGDHKVEMFGEDVLFGEIPTDDPAAAVYFKTMRAAFQPGYREAFTHWLRNATKFRSESMAFSMLNGREQAALSEGSDPSGGFMVPPDVQAEMLVRTAQKSVMRRLARSVTTSRDKVVFPRVAANTGAGLGSIYSSGFVGGWVGETPAFTDTDPAFGTFEVGLKKLRVATKLSNDFLSDAAVNILAWLSVNGAENMALVEDSGFIAGDGSPLQPLGILNSAAATVDVEGSTANTISNTTAAAGSAPKLIDVQYALPSQYAENANWLMRRAIEGKIRKLVDFQSRFMWPALSGSAFAGTPRTLMDDPINNSEFVPNDGTDTNKVLIYGDFTNYIIAQRAQITTVVLRERFADNDQTGIILFERVGGALWNEDAIRIGVV
jgi:HK97 family phage major capsid protein